MLNISMNYSGNTYHYRGTTSTKNDMENQKEFPPCLPETTENGVKKSDVFLSKTTPPHEDIDTFTNVEEQLEQQWEQELQMQALINPVTTSDAMDESELSTTATIFSSSYTFHNLFAMQYLEDYTVYNTGTFPDSSFFEDKFDDLDFSLSSDSTDVIGIAQDENGNIIGYSSPCGYDVWFEYAENSTPENPIMNVRLSNYYTKEAWEGTMNINDIDPNNASKVEMIVLSSHLTGDPITFLNGSMNFDRPYETMDYLSLLQDTYASFDPSFNTVEFFDSLKYLLDMLDDSSEDEDYSRSQENYVEDFQNDSVNVE